MCKETERGRREGILCAKRQKEVREKEYYVQRGRKRDRERGTYTKNEREGMKEIVRE